MIHRGFQEIQLKFFSGELGASAVRDLRIRPATFLILLAASARARIVASNFFSRAHHLLDLHVTSPGHARLFQLFLFLALEGLLDIVHGSCDLARRTSIAGSATGGDGRAAGIGPLPRQIVWTRSARSRPP